MRRELGLKASVGIAPNKLLAKLASGRAKPDGIAEVLSPLQIAELLHTTPAARMPGFGGSAAEIFAGAAIVSMADLQASLRRFIEQRSDCSCIDGNWC